MTGPRPTSVLCAVCRVLCAVCCADCVLCDTDCVLRYRVKARACTGTGLPTGLPQTQGRGCPRFRLCARWRLP